jgi:GTPase SAR1 family protein
VFDITNAESFRWIKERAEKLKQDRRNNGVVLLGNKKDLSSRREVSTEEARQFSEANAWAYFEVSAAELADSNEDDESQEHDKVRTKAFSCVTFRSRALMTRSGQPSPSSSFSAGTSRTRGREKSQVERRREEILIVDAARRQ